MLYVKDDGTIQLTRGDTARLEITIENSLDGTEYLMDPDDILTFTIKKSVKDSESLVKKEARGHNAFHIEPKDTAELSFRKYFYDVQLTRANGDVYNVEGDSGQNYAWTGTAWDALGGSIQISVATDDEIDALFT